MSYLSLLQATIAQKHSPNELTKLPKPGSVSFVSDPDGAFCQNDTSLAGNLRKGISRLRTMGPPAITRPEVWPRIVEDAARIVDGGWAEQALDLGWSPGDLFGADAGADPIWQSLTVWLGGRRLLLIDERTAVAAEGNARHVYTRRARSDAVMLWDLGAKREVR